MRRSYHAKSAIMSWFFARYCTLAPCWLSVWRHRLSVSSVAPNPARSFSIPHVRSAGDVHTALAGECQQFFSYFRPSTHKKIPLNSSVVTWATFQVRIPRFWERIFKIREYLLCQWLFLNIRTRRIIPEIQVGRMYIQCGFYIVY